MNISLEKRRGSFDSIELATSTTSMHTIAFVYNQSAELMVTNSFNPPPRYSTLMEMELVSDECTLDAQPTN